MVLPLRPPHTHECAYLPFPPHPPSQTLLVQANFSEQGLLPSSCGKAPMSQRSAPTRKRVHVLSPAVLEMTASPAVLLALVRAEGVAAAVQVSSPAVVHARGSECLQEERVLGRQRQPQPQGSEAPAQTGLSSGVIWLRCGHGHWGHGHSAAAMIRAMDSREVSALPLIASLAMWRQVGGAFAEQ